MGDKKNLLLMLVQRSWQGLSGLITLILITTNLSPTYQGWYYTFASLAALFYVFDFGLSNAIIHTSSHFFSDLKWGKDGRIKGKNSLIFLSFLSQSVKKYLSLSLLFCFFVLPLGIIFFYYSNSTHLIKINNWIAPWISLVIFTSFNASLTPYLSVIEGSGKLKEILLIRLYSSIAGSIAIWYLIINNGNLWSLTALPVTTLLFSFFWLLRNKKQLIIKKREKHNLYNWKYEISSFRTQIGITSLSAYIYSQIFIPILFFIEGPKIAGQMGVSLTIAGMLGVLSQSWITSQVPDLGKAVAKKEWLKVDVFFKKSIIHLTVFYSLCSLLVLLCYWFIIPQEYKKRMLETFPFIGILMSVFINQLLWSFSTYLRIFKKEPFAGISLISILISIPLAFIGTYKYSVNGTIISIIFVQLFFSISMSIYILKKIRHSIKANNIKNK
jgi:O-antigen/teichoic acid export membrane protein